jgi:hypothetical protein
MINRIREPNEVGRSDYHARIGRLFLEINSPDHDVQCGTLAMTDWRDIREADAVALLAPLSLHQSAEVRQLVALQLATVPGLGDDPRALQALATLAADGDPKVRAAAARSSFVQNELQLTPDDQSAKSPADRFVDWQQEEQTTIFSFRCPDITTARQLLAIIAGSMAMQTIHRPDEKRTQPPSDRSSDATNDSPRLPDVILDDGQPEVFDLPYKGVPKDVLNISKASIRLPQLLIDA